MWCPGVIAGPLGASRAEVFPVNDGWGDNVADPDTGIIYTPEETRPMPAWADWNSQCDRETAHAAHAWTDPVDQCEWKCPGVKAHHLTQIGKGGPHDPHKHDYRKDYA
jgi:hypothetical protein